MRIPSSSISRLSLYYRVLLSSKGSGFISSQELGDLTECSGAQIRKDLAYFGQFGRPGCGYPVEVLKKELRKILGIDKLWDVALVGVGNLGSALLAYKGFKSQGFNIKYAFDNDKKKIGKTKETLKIKNIEDLRETVISKKIDMAIVAVSQDAASKVIETLVSSGVKAMLNFAPVRPKVPEGVRLLNIDLSMELEKLTYFLKRVK